MYRYALCFGIIFATYISWPTSNTLFARNPFLRLLDIDTTLHAYSGFSLSSEMYTTSDVTRLFWPRQDGRQF